MNIAKAIFFQTKNPVPLLILACLLAMPATAQVNYAVSGNTAYVASSPYASGNIVIASSYNDLPVTGIVESAFYFCFNLTSVAIPNSVTSIGNRAFYGCARLTSVAIPDSVTSIGDETFYHCMSLTNVMIPNSVTSIGGDAFYNCMSLTSVAIPNSVTSIGDHAFYACTNLTSLTIPNSVTNIGDGAFSQCTSVTNFSVGAANSVYSSFDGVLFNKAQTTLIQFPGGRGGSYAIPHGVTNIEDHAFSACFSLTSVTIPNSVTTVGDYAFLECENLMSVTIPDSVASIGGGAFSSCIILTNMTIGNGVTNIGDYAFNGCTSLTNFSVGSANSVYSSLNGVLFNKAQTIFIQFPGGRGGSYAIPNTVTSVAGYAFYNCISLKSVTIPDSVASIGGRAFSSCIILTNMTIGNSVTSIGDYAFSNCTSLTNLTFFGNAPSAGLSIFGNVAAGAKVCYYYGTAGWGPTYGGLPTVMLGAPAPQVGAGSAGVKPGGFGFTLSGVVNQTIVVEVSTNLTNWQPIWTSTLSAISTNFVDPNWVNFPHRFYRLRSN